MCFFFFVVFHNSDGWHQNSDGIVEDIRLNPIRAFVLEKSENYAITWHCLLKEHGLDAVCVVV